MVLEKVVSIEKSFRKLTKDMVAKIRKAKCSTAVEVYELAVKYEVSPSTIYRIRGKKC